MSQLGSCKRICISMQHYSFHTNSDYYLWNPNTLVTLLNIAIQEFHNSERVFSFKLNFFEMVINFFWKPDSAQK